MPTGETILGFSNRWYRPAIAAAQRVPIVGLLARIITPIYYLATKLEAFRSRGRSDYSGSHRGLEGHGLNPRFVAFQKTSSAGLAVSPRFSAENGAWPEVPAVEGSEQCDKRRSHRH